MLSCLAPTLLLEPQPSGLVLGSAWSLLGSPSSSPSMCLGAMLVLGCVCRPLGICASRRVRKILCAAGTSNLPLPRPTMILILSYHGHVSGITGKLASGMVAHASLDKCAGLLPEVLGAGALIPSGLGLLSLTPSF